MSGSAGFLISRGTNVYAGWTIAACIDAGLAISLVADKALSTHGVRVGWGGVLRWASGLATLGLNAGGPALAGDVLDAVLHGLAPLFVIVTVEAATAYTYALSPLG